MKEDQQILIRPIIAREVGEWRWNGRGLRRRLHLQHGIWRFHDMIFAHDEGYEVERD